MAESRNGVHILVFPYPAQGHMLPLLDLTHQLVIRGLKITVLITPKNLPILNPLLSANPSIQTLILPFPEHPSIPSGVENVKDIGNQGNISIIAALRKLHDPIIQWFKSHRNPPVAIISDFFLGWTQNLADEIGIPRITFYSSGAFAVAVFEYLWKNSPVISPGDAVKFEDLPHSPSFIWDHLPSLFRRYKAATAAEGSEPNLEVVRDSMLANRFGWASIFNSFAALEGEYLDYLGGKLGIRRVFSLGPLNLFDGPNRMGAPIDRPNSGDGLLSWLDGCPDKSVLYVCFGSQKLLKKPQMEALAIGLEQSGVRFIWVVKPLTAQQVASGYGSVPNGFEDRVVGRGRVIIGWAPQAPILSHQAVGGFLSHCGWNSVLEAVSTRTMILCWPMEADQFGNATLLVDCMGVAIRVCEGGDTIPDPTELSQKIKESMREDVVARTKASKLSDKALEAVKIGGSSSSHIDRVVRELSQLNVQNV